MNKGLTSFRALAFFAVFFFHEGVFNAGYLGVQGFFVLSGFLLTPILIDMKSSLGKKDFFVHFYGRRALRIFPLYYAYLILIASISFLAISQFGYTRLLSMYRFLEQLPWSTTFTYDFYRASKYFKETFLASHLWSLAVEEQFYLIWPLLIFITPQNHLKKLLLLVAAAGPLARLLLAAASAGNMLPYLSPQTDVVIYFLPISHADAFAIGGYFALYGKIRPGYSVWASILLVLVLGLVTSWLSTGMVHWDTLGYGSFMKDSYKYAWGYSVMNLMFAYVLVHIRSGAFMPALLENPLLVYLGTISYGLYVFHLPVIWLIYMTMHRYSNIIQGSTALLVTLIISTISYELMEKRFINLKDKYFARASAHESPGQIQVHR